MITDIFIDIETNRLIDPDVIHLVVVHDGFTGEYAEFTNKDVFINYVSNARFLSKCKWIAHNGIEFDFPQLKRLWGVDLEQDEIADTLVLSRLYNPKLPNGHSLEAWGERFNLPKLQFHDFSKLTDEMIEYCKRDVALTMKLYKWLMKRVNWPEAIYVETEISKALRDAKTHGFYFNVKDAMLLRAELVDERSKMDAQINLNVPPRQHEEIFIPKVNNKTRGYVKGVPFAKRWEEPFNPNSLHHVIDLMWEHGWKPEEKTKGYKEFLKDGDKNSRDYHKVKERYERYGWKLSEGNLATLPDGAPGYVTSILKRNIIENRVRKLDEWLGLVGPDNRIHGTIVGLGTWTHRMAHQNPNVGNISAKKSIKYFSKELNELATVLGGRMRALWMAAPGKVLVGTDAEGIQLRVLAHYMNDPEFIKAVTEGNKDDGTDPHTLNQKRIGRGTRDNAKTFIYAFLLGAGDAKVGEIYNIGIREGARLKEDYVNSTPGLKSLKSKRIPKDAAQGYAIGFDGRQIKCSSQHKMMAAYLQGGEAIIMKVAVVISIRQLRDLQIDAYLVNVVHDEMIFECDPKDAQFVRAVTERSIKEAGELLKLNCPMKGEGKIGNDWLQVH